MRKITGDNLTDFVIPDDTTWVPQHWPWIGLSIDQGPDGVSAYFFLAYKLGVNVCAFWDIFHTAWRAQEAAMKSVGISGFAYLMFVLLSLMHGPYDTASRYHQLQESSREYLCTHARDCPIFALFKEDIIQDFNLNLMGLDDNEAWDVLRKRMLSDRSLKHK